ncbi:FAD-dependent oxidoreductase [Leifsonia sp. NPDC058230]|uniref:FAD-dependent oxidoreductase n=1 Tax=Leifsonia sp. NPDC058230 TaxID=3346391 RepID=UPI0036DA93AE
MSDPSNDVSGDVDIVVIGGGAMGSAAAWQLARRGRSVLLLERFEVGHVFGASHGRSRNFNTAYSDPVYAEMLAEALRLWRELEHQTGQLLLTQVGIVNHGPNPEFDRVAAALERVGLSAAFLSPEAASERWPGIRFDGRVLYSPDSGRLDADAAVAALQAAAAALGADVRHGVRVTDIASSGDRRVRVTTESGVVHARRAVVTAGAWTEKLLGRTVRLPRLRVTQEQPAHFALRDASAAASAAAATTWPGFNHSYDRADPRYGYWRSPIYGMYTPGLGVKAGWHGAGPEVDPDRRDFLPEPQQLDDLRRYVEEWLPGADPDRFDPISCTYTSTSDENFVLDRVGPIVVGAGFSGHGFKFTPTVGRILADLATDAGPAPQLFRLAR